MTIAPESPTEPARPRFVRADGPDKVTGTGRYAADLTLTGQLFAKFRYAGVPHGRITKLDTSAAKAIPGVFAVLTQDDVPDVRYGDGVKDRTLFAEDVVRYEAEIVAAVAAVSAEVAQAAVGRDRARDRPVSPGARPRGCPRRRRTAGARGLVELRQPMGVRPQRQRRLVLVAAARRRRHRHGCGRSRRHRPLSGRRLPCCADRTSRHRGPVGG